MDKILRRYDSEIKEMNEGERSMTALVSTADRDRMGEVLLPDGADLSDYKKNPVVLWAHDYHTPPIGRALWIKKTADGIMAKIQFAKTQLAEEIYSLYKDGFMKAFSVGFIPKEWVDGDGDKKPRRTYNKWELIEFSAVPVPANPEALALAVSKGLKLSDILIKALIPEAKAEEGKEYCTIPDCPCEGKGLINHEEIHVEKPKIDKALIDTITELEAEITLLKEAHTNEIKAKDKEISDIKYALYVAAQNSKPTEKMLSEMSAGDIEKTIEDIAGRAIRKHTGKVD